MFYVNINYSERKKTSQYLKIILIEMKHTFNQILDIFAALAHLVEQRFCKP
jgi:hypothetical protein